MCRVKCCFLVALAMCLALASPLQAALSNKPDNTVTQQPGVNLSPQDVVRIVVNALSRNDQPYVDAGIATTFAFASPGNRVNTGPLEKFKHMVKSHPYGIMVNHVASQFSEVVRVGNSAYQLVELTGRDNRVVVFAFRLSRQLEGEFKDMWMTDAVWPVGNGESFAPAL